MKSIKEKQLLVKWSKAMGEEIDPALLEEVERYEKLQAEIINSVRKNSIKDLAEASIVAEKIVEKINVEFPKPPTLEELMEVFETQVKDLNEVVEELGKTQDKQEAESTVNSQEENNSKFDLISMAVEQIKKDVLQEKESFQQPEPSLVDKDLTSIQKKLKFLEQAIGKIAATGPGGGEVRLEYLDDVDRSTAKVDGKFLKYDAASGKWIGADGGSGGSVDEEVVVDLITQNERLVYTTSDQYRIITGYREDDEVLSIRATAIAGAHLRFELASFSPGVSASGQSLAWDQAATGFSVSVDNPTDFTERWINAVSLIDNSTGVHTTLGNYTTSGPSATPAGGVDWSQTFSTNATATIRSNGSGLSGGSASARITFKDNDDTDWGTKPTISFNWGSVGHSVNFSNLSGKTFLDYYSSVGYTVSVTGFSSGANYVNTVSGSGGTPSNGSGSGTFTFTTGLHKDNNSGRTVNLSTNFNRPAAVTGTAYTVTNATSDSSISASFSYPSFYYWTVNTSTPPTRADIVSGYGFEAGVVQLGNQTKVVNGFINNTDSNPRAFWFGVRTAASQPSSFQTGPTAGLLSDTSVTTGNSLNLEPDSPLAGYVAEGYTLYGITLQPGSTYVSIS